MFNRSPETTAAGMLAALGFLTFLTGAILKITEAITAGLGMVSLASTLLGFLARSEKQHDRDKQEGKT